MIAMQEDPIGPALRRLLAGLVVAAVVVAGCGGGAQQSVDDLGADAEADAVPLGNVIEVRKASPEEQAAAASMMDEALEDGAMTAEELEAFALETVECARRGGFDARLDSFNAEWRTFGFSVSAANQSDEDGPGEDLAGGSLSACEETYFYPAYDEFERTNPQTEEEYQRIQKQREQAVLDCALEAGFEFETLEDYLAGHLDLPTDVAVACTNAYNEK